VTAGAERRAACSPSRTANAGPMNTPARRGYARPCAKSSLSPTRNCVAVSYQIGRAVGSTRRLPPSGGVHINPRKSSAHLTPFRDAVLVLTADASSFSDALTKPIAAMLDDHPATLALEPSPTVPAIIIVGSNPHSARTDLNRLRPGIGRPVINCAPLSSGLRKKSKGSPKTRRTSTPKQRVKVST
jgi:hypothetical protein